jgi:hypothetical protein
MIYKEVVKIIFFCSSELKLSLYLLKNKDHFNSTKGIASLQFWMYMCTFGYKKVFL